MSQKPSQQCRCSLPLAASVLCAAVALGACQAQVAPTGESLCRTQRLAFHQEVWGPLLLGACQGCHGTSGEASLDAKSRFVLLPDTYPHAAHANLDALRAMAEEHINGTSFLLAKVSGEVEHGGGALYAKDSAEYAALQRWVQALAPGAPDCAHLAVGMDARLLALPLLDAPATFRKAALNIAGRLPTQEEYARLSDSEAALEEAVDALLEEEAFYGRLQEVFNDAFFFLQREQTGQLSQTRFVSGAFQTAETAPDYPDIAAKLASQGGDSIERSLFLDRLGQSMWEEPLALIAHVARHNRPFTEILTADYVLLNDYSAYAYGLAGEPPHGTPVNAWRAVPGPLWQRQGTDSQAPLPVAGLLSTAAFLTRWPTTATNGSRGRAEFLSKNFLATSILSFAQRPVNSTQLEATGNPVVNNPACSVCHYYMDGLAATFTGFHPWLQASFQPGLSMWRDRKYLPSFQGEEFPSPRTRDNGLAMPWMAQRIAADPRFPYAMVLRVFEGITGRKPLEYPRDVAQADYAAHLSAWESQNAFFHEVAARMAQQGMNIKVAFRLILLGPYFRAAQGEELPAELALGLGEGRLLSPELLARKIRATLGVHWGRFRSGQPFDYLTARDHYNVLYGGVHPADNRVRARQINALMAAIAHAMAKEMACRLPAWEFSKPPHERAVLPLVEKETKPLLKYGATLEANPDGERAIRDNLAFLHQRLLGENVAPNSPEVDISFELFSEAWKERAEEGNTQIFCNRMADLSRAANDNPGGADYASLPQQDILRDENFTLYAWKVVLSYLLMDFRFIHE